LILRVTASALGSEPAWSYTVHGTADGKSYEFNVTAAVVAQTPSWAPADENPPFSPRRAEEIARGKLQELVPTGSEWPLREITLATFAGSLHWLYVVTFEPPGRESVAESLREHMRIPVLFDGRVIEPTVTAIPK
jgi:hypothetical protein